MKKNKKWGLNRNQCRQRENWILIVCFIDAVQTSCLFLILKIQILKDLINFFINIEKVIQIKSNSFLNKCTKWRQQHQQINGTAWDAQLKLIWVELCERETRFSSFILLTQKTLSFKINGCLQWLTSPFLPDPSKSSSSSMKIGLLLLFSLFCCNFSAVASDRELSFDLYKWLLFNL